MKKQLAYLCLASAALTSSAVMADEAEGFYLGAGLGSTTFDDDGWIRGMDWKAEDNTQKLFAGYQFNRIIAIEFIHSDYGKMTTNDSVYLYGSGQTVYGYQMDPKAFSVVANAGYSFDSGWRPFGMFGLSTIDLNQSHKLIKEKSGLSFHWGIGAQYSTNAVSGLQLRFMIEGDLVPLVDEYDDDEYYDMSMASFNLNIGYHF